MIIEEGRPADAEKRLEKERRVYDLLDGLGVRYKRADHEAAMTYLLMMPGDKKFKTKDLSAQLKTARLSFANETYMEEFLDITPGSVSVLGLMNDHEKRVKLVIDRDILKGAFVGCHPCINTSSLQISTEDLMEKVVPAMGHEPVLVDLPRHEEEQA